MKILVSGATGNIGRAIIENLFAIQTQHEIVAGVRNVEKAKSVLSTFKELAYREFDLEHPKSFLNALQEIDIVFLLRPPHLADVKSYFVPFFDAMKACSVKKIMFLSVQGVEAQKAIPHHKIEKAIREYGFDSILLRPSYFMENLTTTLLKEIVEQRKVFVPSGKLKFNWVAVDDIGLVGAKMLNAFDTYKNTAIEVTGSDFEGFHYAAQQISESTKENVTYDSPNLFRFFIEKRKAGVAPMMILVMIMLHYLPRFGNNTARLTDAVERVGGRKPITLQDFIRKNRMAFASKGEM